MSSDSSDHESELRGLMLFFDSLNLFAGHLDSDSFIGFIETIHLSICAIAIALLKLPLLAFLPNHENAMIITELVFIYKARFGPSGRQRKRLLDQTRVGSLITRFDPTF